MVIRCVCAAGLPRLCGAGDALTSVVTCNLHFQHWCTQHQIFGVWFSEHLGDQIWTTGCTELCLTFNGVCVLFPKFLREKIRGQVS